MGDRSIINGGMVVFMAAIGEFMGPLKWIFIAAAVLVLVDLRFGIAAARARGEPVRPSRAVRRTINKMVDYLCWIILSGVIGQAFGVPLSIPLLPLIILLVIFGCEINSCYSNYFESKGKKIKVNVFRLFAKKLDVIEPEDESDKNTIKS